ncbi:DUF4215 domain-containing protein [Cystobacter fuscus]
MPLENQQRALELFQAGNALLKDAVFVKASEKYREALGLWSHPAIHYNLALALMNLDQPLEVHEHLVAALRFGAEPLETEKYEYARNYKLLLEKQLARLDITCDTTGATVLLDGKPLFQAPGNYSGLVRPGAHTLAATRQGYLPQNLNRTLLPGETAHVALRLYTNEELTRYRRRFPVPMPWLVMGAGVALAGGSAWMHVRGRAHFRSFDEGISACGGCVPPPPRHPARAGLPATDLGHRRLYRRGRGLHHGRGPHRAQSTPGLPHRPGPARPAPGEHQPAAGWRRGRSPGPGALLGKTPMNRVHCSALPTRRDRPWPWAVLLGVPFLVFFFTACFEPTSVICSTGLVCPAGQQCAANQDVCIKTDCGDGRLQPGEACDDGNLLEGDGCSRDCRSIEVCGNGIVDVSQGEKCDDGNTKDGDKCGADCKSNEACGNGITDTQVGERCDDGNNDNGDGCSADCLSLEVCGNGYTDGSRGEQCDDGNTEGGDGCSADCKSNEICGNGIVDRARGEVCDDGNTEEGDGCSVDCKSDETCGNGIVDRAAGELCDDGNTLPNDECSFDCRSGKGCGNGIRDDDEECDDGNTSNNDNCRNSCQLATCGDAFVDRQQPRLEDCDDGKETKQCNHDCTGACAAMGW